MVPSTTDAQHSDKKPAALSAGAGSAPWYLWCGVLAITSACAGLAWDVAWHRSIGRDGFWTAPHVTVYMCGVLAAVMSGYLLYTATFGRSEKSYSEKIKAASVSVLGFRAPLGAFIAAWGGIAMLTSAPFDNWWHAAYGVDLKVESPPHAVLILGVFAIAMGVLYLVLPAMNRAAPAKDKPADANYKVLRRLFLYAGGIIVTLEMLFLVSYTWEGKLHSVSAYTDVALLIPLMVATLSWSSRHRWAATWSIAVYTTLRLLELWILPLVPAQPKLGPVYFPVTHLVPAKFPLLIIIPAIALDLLWQRTRSWKPWKISVFSGVVFIAVLLAVQWPFASFLLTKHSENWFFGTMYFNYNSLPTSADRMRIFEAPTHGVRLVWGIVRAAAYGAAGTWFGIRSGRQMRRLQR
jgi:hypothetical protein